MTKTLVTSALPYTNGPIHVGHAAGVHLPADIYYRFLKSCGEECVSLCGSDDHGVGIEIAAQKAGTDEETLIQRYRKEIFETLSRIDITYDVLHGTHTQEHMAFSQQFFEDLQAKGYIEKREESQMFCKDCSQFLPDRYIEGTCPHCQRPNTRGDQCEACSTLLDPKELINPCCKICNGHNLEEKPTYNYYFLLTKVAPLLGERLATKNFKKNVMTVAEKWMKEGLQDRSVSRDIKRGIPIQSDLSKKMYVRFEAPLGYISFLSMQMQHLWQKGADSKIVHFLGKDNIPFHVIMRPALLLAQEEYKLPDEVVGNEFLNLENQKISTSRNYAVWVHDLVEILEPDQIRNYLIHCIPENKDTNFSVDEFVERNNHIAGSLGNFLNRLVVLYQRNFNGQVAHPDVANIAPEYLIDMHQLSEEVENKLHRYKIREAYTDLMKVIKLFNQNYQAAELRNLVKTDPKAAHNLLNLYSLYMVQFGILLAPFLPRTAEKILQIYRLHEKGYGYRDIGTMQLEHVSLEGEYTHLFQKLTKSDLEGVFPPGK